MAPTLAKYIGDNFTVKTRIESDDILGSGFDATVWRANNPDGTVNLNGKLYLSMQGTTGLGDLLSDIDLATSGNARNQLADMVNWWLSVSTPVGQQATQIAVIGGAFFAATSVAGLGLVTAAELANGMEVNGHSLGGYLATAFTRLFGSEAHVSHTSTFNGAGFAPGSESVFANLQNLIGPSYGLGRFPNGVEQSNYFAKNGINVTTNSLWFSQQGTRVELFNEAGITVPNHFMYKLTDALSLGNALLKLDSTLTTDKLNVIFEAGSNNSPASIEGVFDGLRRMIQGNGVAPTPIGDVSDSADTRVTYQSNLKDLTESDAFQSLAGKLIIKPTNASDLVGAARNNFGALVALQDLSPLTVSAINPAADALLATVWQNTRAADYVAWSADKATSTHTTFTDNWIRDRAALLHAIVTRNQSDSTAATLTSTSVPTDRALQFQWYGATPSPSEILLGLDSLTLQHPGFTGTTVQKIAFGDDGSNALIGTDNTLGDHLYAGAGNDTLNGLSGNDYLEGGIGTDTYNFTTNFGKDTLLDTDGLGQLQIDAATLSGGKGAGRNVWVGKDSAGLFEGYAVYDDARSSTGKRLVITRAGNTDNTITIDNFNLNAAQGPTGYLGIHLDPTVSMVVKEGTGSNLFADFNFNPATLSGSSAIVEGTGKTFTLYLNQAAKAGETITLALSDLADMFQAILGDTTVPANGAVITLAEGQTQVSFALVQDGAVSANGSMQLSATYTGATSSATSNAWGVNLSDAGPVVNTYTGDQRAPAIDSGTYNWGVTAWAADGTLTGGVAEADFADVLEGSTNADTISGLGGNDALDGGAGNDQIDGGEGDDLIGGGAGNDNIRGGSGADFISSSATLSVLQRVNATDSWSPPAGQTVITQGPGWGNDLIRGCGGIDFIDAWRGGNDTSDSATYFAPICPSFTVAIGRFDCEEKSLKVLNRRLHGHWGRNTAHASPMRLAEHKWMGRRVNSISGHAKPNGAWA